MKVGIDIHGTIDSDPDLFRELIAALREILNAEIHVTTGIKGDVAKEKLAKLGIEYDYLFSITDYHESIGTAIIYDEDGPWIEEETWNRSKGDYCEKEKIDVHIDDTEAYAKYFTTPFYLYNKEEHDFGETL